MRKQTLLINKTYNYRVVSPYKYSSDWDKWINQQLPHCAKVCFLSLRYRWTYHFGIQIPLLLLRLPFTLLRSFPSGCRCFPSQQGISERVYIQVKLRSLNFRSFSSLRYRVCCKVYNKHENHFLLSTWKHREDLFFFFYFIENRRKF